MYVNILAIFLDCLSSQISKACPSLELQTRYPILHDLDPILNPILSQASLKQRKKDISSSDAQRYAGYMAGKTEAFLAILNIFNVFTVLAIPSFVIHFTVAEPLPSGSLIFMAMVLWMKLVSYAHCNADLR